MGTLGLKLGPPSPETRTKIAAGLMGNQNTRGRTLKLSAEQRALRSSRLMGRTLSAETRAKLSAARLGRTLSATRSAEHRANLSAALLGSQHSAEHRAANSAAHMGQQNALRHGHCRPRTPTYSSWRSMLNRCTNTNGADWKDYGGRTQNPVRIEDPRWLVFEHFLADMGERPAGTSIDRIDGQRGYFKENCRWATPSEQAKNRRPRRRKT